MESIFQKNLALCYQFKTGESGKPIRLIPDACLDFLFHCNEDNPSAIISGIQTIPYDLELEPNSVYFGFKPYSLMGMKQLPIAWHEILDNKISFSEQFGNTRIIEALASLNTFEDRVEAIQSFALDAMINAGYTPDFVELSELYICNEKGNVKMDTLNEYTGYTGRYCREKFKEALGISIKSYANIMRFQNAVRGLFNAQNDDCLSDVVFDNGYFDQSHLNREFRRYSGEPPLSYRREYLSR